MSPDEVLFLVAIVSLLTFVFGIVPLYIENGRLIFFAQRLDRPRLVQGAFRLLRRVEGTRDGRRVVLDVTRSGKLELRVAARSQLGPLTIRRRFRRRREARLVSSFQLVGPEEPCERVAEAVERVPAVDRRLGRSLDAAEELGCYELRLEDGWLVVTIRRVRSLELDTLVDSLVRLSDALGSATLVRGSLRELSAQTQRCPFCHDGIGGETTSCGACASVHHGACWEEHGGCSVFGCAAGARGRPAVRTGDGPA